MVLTSSASVPHREPNMVGSDEIRRKRERLRRRKRSLFRKAFQFGKLCEADVAVIIHNNGRFSTYRSMDRESWPPSMKDIVRLPDRIY